MQGQEQSSNTQPGVSAQAYAQDPSPRRAEPAVEREAGKPTGQRQLSTRQRHLLTFLPGRDEGLAASSGEENISHSLLAGYPTYDMWVSICTLVLVPQQLGVGLEKPPELRSPWALLSCSGKNLHP